MPKLVVIGLDCATPEFLFKDFKADMPNVSKILDNGIYGNLRSTTPAITVPAWMSMMTSKDPGQLGVFGFRNRKPGSGYDDMWIATAAVIKEKKIWQYLNENGYSTGMLGVPQTFPVEEVNGFMVSSFLTPSLESEYTYPHELRDEIEKQVGEYIFDFANRSTEPPATILKAIYLMTEKRFNLFKHFIETKNNDFMMMVEMGVDRIHHYMWSYVDPKHPKFQGEDNKFKDCIKNYYIYLDEKIGEIIKTLPEDCKIMLVSDHGAKAMQGMFLLNEWLIQEGYLVLKEYPDEVTKLHKCEIDWSKSKAWAWGGFYSRIFFNVKGREPEGIIEPEKFEQEKHELIKKLEAVKDDEGNLMGNKIYRPEDLYEEINGDPPDLLGFFGDLSWRPGGTVGHNKLYIHENDTGPDDGVHDWNGIYAIYDPKNPQPKKQDQSIYDIAPTVLNIFNIDVPKDMKGKIIN
ncbi:MAG: alkaline phosphatase family protein [Patescibacteria group bacterium]|nr:alkaline phosphatase family protein [Patescibacteria group bacterium]